MHKQINVYVISDRKPSRKNFLDISGQVQGRSNSSALAV